MFTTRKYLVGFKQNWVGKVVVVYLQIKEKHNNFIDLVSINFFSSACSNAGILLKKKNGGWGQNMAILVNPLSVNPTKWSNTLKLSRQIADELFECVWPFFGVGV